jgi:hypothetical protein
MPLWLIPVIAGTLIALSMVGIVYGPHLAWRWRTRKQRFGGWL